MIKGFLCFLFLVLCHMSIVGMTDATDSLLKKLDRAITQKEEFAVRRIARMDSIRKEAMLAPDKAKRFEELQKLFRRYRSYQLDSAFTIAQQCIQLAETIDDEKVAEAEMNMSEVLGVMGIYKESMDILHAIPKDRLDTSLLAHYYHLHHATYSLLAENALTNIEKDKYNKLIQLYRDSLLRVNDPATLGYNMLKSKQLLDSGQYEEALSLMQDCYDRYHTDESLLASVSYELSLVYEKLQDTEQEKKYLTISALADIRRAVKSYIALRKLAVMLYQEGDLDRAYSYIKCAMEDATFCKARFRTMEISETLPIIIAAYDKKMQQEKENLFKYLILISVLSLVLAASIYYVYRQLRKLSAAEKAMKKLNDELSDMNVGLQELNKSLSESNLVKEEYIGSVFNLCSSYIDKLDSYRVSINRKLRVQKIEDVIRLTDSKNFVSEELKEFFQNFDAIFLNIYPNFIDEFNALLKEGEQIHPKNEELLSAELRIYALIKLGITDSSKIATFLHYSPQTVYNYKLKVRNKSRIPKDEFMDALQKIGR
ncbi:DUF6377 domain-containing protein [Sphingobacterium chuzhouense]|nr:DUF6377 domain-containing protein [Sphingobacterium chuzhouense]